MRLARTLVSLLLFSNLFFSCTVDPIDDLDLAIEIEDILSTGDDGHSPPDDDKGNGNE